NRHDLGQLKIAQRKLTRFRFIIDRDFVAGFHIEGSDVDVAAIDLNVAVRHELARSVARIRQTETINHIIEPRFEKLEQCFTSNAAFTQSVLENPAELTLEQSVLVTQLLFLAESDRIVRLLSS